MLLKTGASVAALALALGLTAAAAQQVSPPTVRPETPKTPLAGQIVMEGFLNLRLRPWLRRLITRLLAIIPAIIVIVIYGDRGTGALLILSQVILSLQLPFAVFPLVMFTGDRRKMGLFVAPLWMRALAWPIAVIIAVLNVWLLIQVFRGL